MANTLVQWIPACMGCGSQDQANLVKKQYTWHHSRQGVGVVKYTTLPVVGWLCHDCAQKARGKFKTVLISLLVIGIASIVIGALASGGVLSQDVAVMNAIEIPMTATIIIGFGGALAWLYFRYSPLMFYHSIKQGKIRATLHFTFKNPLFAALFNAANPNLDVKGNTTKLESEDLKNIEELQDLGSFKKDEPKAFESIGGSTPGKAPETTPITKTCPQCKWILQYKSKFCNKCGYKFQNVEDTPQEL